MPFLIPAAVVAEGAVDAAAAGTALGFAPEVADGITLTGLGGVVAGSVAGWCAKHGGAGCVNGPHTNGRNDPRRRSEPFPQMWIRQAEVGPCNVPMYNYQQCKKEVEGQKEKVMSSIPSTGVAQFDNVPQACMNLASVMVGSCTGGGISPTLCGGACLKYTGLTDAHMAALSNLLS